MRIISIKFLLLFCFLFSIKTVNAECFSVYVDGNEVSNGSIVTSYEVNPNHLAVGALMLEPKVVLRVLEPCHLAVTVENTITGKSETVQFCWQEYCTDLKKGESFTKEKDFIQQGNHNLKIDAIVSDFNRDKTYLVSSKVTIIADRDKDTLFSFDLNMVYLPANYAELKTIPDSEEATVFYDLTGNQIKNPTKGIYIVHQGEKTYKVRL